MGTGRGDHQLCCLEWPGSRPPGHGPYLVPTQGREDESILTHDAVWELLLAILILSRPQGECELGELGLTELSERSLLSASRWREETGLQPTGPLTVPTMGPRQNTAGIGQRLPHRPRNPYGRTHAGPWALAEQWDDGHRTQSGAGTAPRLIPGTPGTGTPGPSPGTRLSCGHCPAPCRPGRWLGRSCLCPRGRSPAMTERGDQLCSPHTGRRWTWLSAWPA